MSEMISWDEFEKVDIRTGTIVSAEPFPEARKPSIKMRIDFGPASAKRSPRRRSPSTMRRQILSVAR
ncbi:hypothetical protein DFR52_106135 [Hoeflea marina]|uniref:tRNA-binding protein n=1 Tax=Hoeflea marina TaxID=274592 RepID=A0A317PFA1_9HYPH|nr:hypothetical protein DFR52_106135 [Hoeflea marina]